MSSKQGRNSRDIGDAPDAIEWHLGFVRDHTSLVAWQRAALVASSCVKLQRAYWKPELGALFHQLGAASLSVRLNLSEGYALRLPGLQRHHYRIAYGSAVETVELLTMLEELEVGVPADHLRELTAVARESCRLSLGLLKTISKQ